MVETVVFIFILVMLMVSSVAVGFFLIEDSERGFYMIFSLIYLCMAIFLYCNKSTTVTLDTSNIEVKETVEDVIHG